MANTKRPRPAPASRAPVNVSAAVACAMTRRDQATLDADIRNGLWVPPVAPFPLHEVEAIAGAEAAGWTREKRRKLVRALVKQRDNPIPVPALSAPRPKHAPPDKPLPVRRKPAPTKPAPARRVAAEPVAVE